MPRPLPPELKVLKVQARQSWEVARKRATISLPVLDALWSDTLLCVDHASDRAAGIMLTQTVQLFGLLAMRRRWLHPPQEPALPADPQRRRSG
jgi:hypothetical protein